MRQMQFLVLGGLGFLGLGLPDEEVAEWGPILKQALPALSTGIWWTYIFPWFGTVSHGNWFYLCWS